MRLIERISPKRAIHSGTPLLPCLAAMIFCSERHPCLSMCKTMVIRGRSALQPWRSAQFATSRDLRGRRSSRAISASRPRSATVRRRPGPARHRRNLKQENASMLNKLSQKTVTEPMNCLRRPIPIDRPSPQAIGSWSPGEEVLCPNCDRK